MARNSDPPGDLASVWPAEEAHVDILIVDDRPDKRLVYQTILEDLGPKIFMAESGRQALKHVLEREFAVILLDVNMPGMDGLETAALIRNRGRSAHVPIIFITADYNDDAHMARGYALGAVDYIGSPVVPEILRAKVKVFVDLYLLAQQAKRQARQHLALVEERVARATAEQATKRLAFLAQASATLAGSLDFAAITRELVQLCVPSVADACALTIVAEAPEQAATELCWPEPDANGPEGALPGHLVGEAANPWLRETIDRVLSSGRPEVLTDLARVATPREARPGLAGGAPGGTVSSIAVVPLVAHGHTLGALSLGLRAPGRQFDTDTLSTATELAGRAAIALDNARLYEKIQDQDRRKDDFLAMLAHELRNPLAPISNAVHVLRESSDNATTVAWAGDVIARQVRQLVRLVDDLLDVCRITRGKIDLKIESIDVARVIAAAVETSRPYVDAQQHTLVVSVPSEPLRLKGDFARVAQILANLINNAAKYTDKGGRIVVTAVNEGGEIVFRVRDSGMGIPKELLTSIFEPFRQIERTLDRSQGGLGVGLTLAQRLVEMQGGTILAYSDGPDRGSEFTVRLPGDPAARVEAPAPELSVAEPGASLDLRVLIVDDNRDVANSTAVLLRSAGCNVDLAYDGEEAIRVVNALRPDVVLLDLGLPKMDGYQVAEQIRAGRGSGRSLIIALSGYGQDEHRLRSKRAGFDYHIVKPIEPTALTGLLASLWSCRKPEAPDGGAFSARESAN